MNRHDATTTLRVRRTAPGVMARPMTPLRRTVATTEGVACRTSKHASAALRRPSARRDAGIGGSPGRPHDRRRRSQPSDRGHGRHPLGARRLPSDLVQRGRADRCDVRRPVHPRPVREEHGRESVRLRPEAQLSQRDEDRAAPQRDAALPAPRHQGERSLAPPALVRHQRRLRPLDRRRDDVHASAPLGRAA